MNNTIIKATEIIANIYSECFMAQLQQDRLSTLCTTAGWISIFFILGFSLVLKTLAEND